MRNTIISLFLLLCLPLWAQSQPPVPSRIAIHGGKQPQLVRVSCQDAASLATMVRHDGYTATAVGDRLLVVQAPAAYLRRLASDQRVSHIELSRQLHLCMDDVRVESNVERVHAGEGLDTPYRGRGVLIGVIDQGFEYRHIAFEDASGQSRLLGVWNRSGYKRGQDSAPVFDIPATGDTLTTSGHGTHVANISAGQHIPENDFYGVAPEASLFFISSELVDAEVFEEICYLSDFASSRSMPCVINLSIGSEVGAHDGTGQIHELVDSVLSSRRGLQIVAAAGNRGHQQMHCRHTFRSDTDTVTLMVKTGGSGTLLDIWCERCDSLRHLSFRPFIYSAGKRTYHDSAFWADRTMEQVSPYNGKHEVLMADQREAVDGSHDLGVEIWGEAGITFDAWTGDNYGNFVVVDSTCVVPDNEFTLCDLYSCVHSPVSVGAYNIRTSVTSLSGEEIRLTSGPEQEAYRHTSHGPMVGGGRKPDVSAPGTALKSAISSYGVALSPSVRTVVDQVWRDGKAYYYGVKSGTSMSAPVVTGVIALWLEANPNMTADEITEIIHQTARHDTHTGDSLWSALYGYGKIDAYAGLQEALRRASDDGVPAILGSETPVSISRERGRWRLLFGSDERTVTVTLTDLSGHLLQSRQLQHVRRGQETSIDLSSLPAGAYILRVATPHGLLTRKIMR